MFMSDLAIGRMVKSFLASVRPGRRRSDAGLWGCEALERRQLLSVSGTSEWNVDQFYGVATASSVALVPAVAKNSPLGAATQPAAQAAVVSPMASSTTYSSNYQPYTIDPSDRLMSSQVLAEWNSTTLDGWTLTNAASYSVGGGSLTVSSQNGTSNPLQISLQNMTSGPYLDYGYFDYMQIRMQLPVNYNKDVTFSFGTNVNTGFSSARTFTIPAAQIQKDGNWHTYRLDLGLQVWWRDTLRDFRIQPLGTTGAGETMSIDYVEVGDLPGDTLTPYTADLNMAAGVTTTSRQSVESKHFVFWWDPNVNPGGRTNWSTMQRNALRMMEEAYQVYYKVQGFREPFNYENDGLRHKVNLTTWYGGYWMGGNYLNVDTSGLQDEGWGNPVPHEFAHVTDGAQGTFLAGGHWESHANYMRERMLEWYQPLFATDYDSMPSSPLQWSNFRQDHGRLIYADYRIHMALQDYAAQLGLPADLASQLWTAGTVNMTVYDKLKSLLPAGTTVQDVVGYVLRYWPELDFSAKAYLRQRLWTTSDERALLDWQSGSVLVPEADQVGWYRVPMERAPEKFAYMYHTLTPTSGSTSITVELRGLDVMGTGEGWRWSLAAVDGSDNVRYSPVYSPGTQTFALNPGENKVLLIVVATPDDTSLDLGSYDNVKPVDKNMDRLRYPYEVRIVGATPTSKQLNWTTASGHFLSAAQGGGWVSNTATIASTAYVGPNARVLGSAKVLGNAKIQDYAVISGSAIVQDNAIVSGYALVYNNAIVQGNARVRDFATLTGGAVVQGNAIIQGHAIVENSTVTDSAIVRSDADTFGGTKSGTTISDYDMTTADNYSDGVQMSHVPWGGWYVPYWWSTQRKPRGLIASYRMEEPSGQMMWDEFGAQTEFLRGTPGRVQDSDRNSQVLELNGLNQYAVMDRNLADTTDASFAMWAKPTSTDANETLFYFGSSATTYMKLVARDTNGFARFIISVNGNVKQFASTAAVPLNQWTHIGLTFGSGTVTFYINGAAAGTLATTYRPVDVLGANDYVNAEPSYIGRDSAGNYFTGRLDDVRFYNVTLTQAEMTNEMNRGGSKIGLFYATTPADFDGLTTTAESGVHNGLVRTIMASIYPRTSDYTGTYYEPIVDSTDENGKQYGSGIGLVNGNFVVRLDGLGMWNTGVPATLNAWQDVILEFNGSVARLYINGTKKASTSYTADPNNLAGKNYRIGYGQTTTDTTTRTYFDGQISNLQIYDRMIPVNDPNALHWDTSATSGFQGGNGTWDDTGTNANWSTDGTTATVWPLGAIDKSASFDSTSGGSWTVTVSGNPTPTGINLGDEFSTTTDAYTLTGGTITVGASGVAAFHTGTINSAILLSATQTWDAEPGQTLTVGGNISTAANPLTFYGSGVTNITGSITGTGSATVTNTLAQQGSGVAYLRGRVSGIATLTQSGTGTFVIGGPNSSIGNIQLPTTGTIIISATGVSAGPVQNYGGHLVINNSLVATPTLSVTGELDTRADGAISTLTAGTITLSNRLRLGHDGSSGVFLITGGTLNQTGSYVDVGFNGGRGVLIVSGTGAYTGGRDLTLSDAWEGNNLVVFKDNANGVFGNINLGNSNGVNGSTSSSNVTVQNNATLTANSLIVGRQTLSTSPISLNQFNQAGGTTTINGTVTLASDQTGGTLTGALNLQAGILSARKVISGTNGGLGLLNFHGGTLTYNGTTAQTDFINLATAGKAYIYEGATINTGAQNVTINQSLLSPNTGNGVSGISVTSGGTYTIAPAVKITGDGVGATAVANLDTNGAIIGITITNPGVGYTTAAATLDHGTGSGGVIGGVTLSPNAYSGVLTKIGSGTLTLGATTDSTVGGLNVQAGVLNLLGHLKVDTTTAARGTPAVALQAVSANALTLGAGAVLDITNHDMIIHYTSGQAASTLAAISNALSSGKIMSSALGAGMSLAVVDNAALTTPYTTFDGITLADTNEILVKFTYTGDANLDGQVTFADFQALLAGYGNTGTWATGDFNASGATTFADFQLLLANYGAGVGSPMAPVAAATTAPSATLAAAATTNLAAPVTASTTQPATTAWFPAQLSGIGDVWYAGPVVASRAAAGVPSSLTTLLNDDGSAMEIRLTSLPGRTAQPVTPAVRWVTYGAANV